jgi:hypothetical protein
MRMKNVIFAVIVLLLVTGCEEGETAAPASDSGVRKVRVSVQTNSSGMTIEQENVAERVIRDNKPGSIKHLYVISAYSGDVLIYSTVKGKVTSSGKRLTPGSVVVGSSGDFKRPGFDVKIGRGEYATSEVLQDDGTYGHSSEYVYWFDVAGRYHQHYITGGQIFHVSDAPLPVRKIILNMELASAPAEQ